MINFFKKNKEIGLPPGTLSVTETPKKGKTEITIINYDHINFEELKTDNLGDALKFINKKNFTWIHIENISDVKIIEEIGEKFNVHNLVLEDILTSHQRPKFEDHENHIFTIIKNFELNEHEIKEEQISFLLGTNYVISIQNTNNRLLEKIKERMKNNKGIIRKKGIDYLFYCFLDIIIDNYFFVMEKTSEKIESIENCLLSNPDKETLKELYSIKNKILFIQKSIYPLREVINQIKTSESRLLKQENKIFFNDIYDHIIQIMEGIQTLREIISNMFEMYTSTESNKSNEIMKVLTIMGSIFIPLTFFAGIYGMNFKFMPELDFKYAYPILWGILITIATTMLIIFKKKKWF